MKIAIITMFSVNYGNRLQNYAMFLFLKKLSIQSQNLYITDLRKKTVVEHTNGFLKRYIKMLVPMPVLKWSWRKKSKEIDPLETQKREVFCQFTNQYMDSKWITLYYKKDLERNIDTSKYQYFFVGSDQVWNPDFAGNDYYFLQFVQPDKRVGFSASIGYGVLPEGIRKKYREYWRNMKYISVREESAAKLIEREIGKKPDVFIDPTFLLTRSEWEDISKKPNIKLQGNYILCLFLGDVPNCLNDYQEKYGIELLMLNDKTYPEYYLLGPSEFIYLIKHASLILTDSFHCTAFSIIFHKSFFVFERIEKRLKSMFTRLENLLCKLKFQDRIQQRKLCSLQDEIQESRFTDADVIIEAERNQVIEVINELLKC